MNQHYSEDDLTLYYYGEARRPEAIDAHLAACERCAALYRDIAGTLAMVPVLDAPERDAQYGLEVWQRIRHRLPEQAPRSWLTAFDWLRTDRLALAGAAAVLLVAAFTAGRLLPGARPPRAAPAAAADARPGGDAGRRILLASIADHLDRSDRVLTDIMNTADPSDLTTERGWAEDLLAASRLYRQDAVDAGEQSIAAVLEELERNLLEVVHSPEKMSAADLDQIRRRIDAAALLFKVRILSEELRQREQAPDDRSVPRTSTRKIS
jgi:Txe/YoeB family toxin of Txe-Axe toxin-antitoxin module